MIYIDGKPLCEVKDIEIETADISSSEAESFIFNNDRTIEFDAVGEIDTKLLVKDLTDVDTKFTLEFPFIRQARRHRKKRINKKWLKRYGIVKEIIRVNNCEVKVEKECTYIITKDGKIGEKIYE